MEVHIREHTDVGTVQPPEDDLLIAEFAACVEGLNEPLAVFRVAVEIRGVAAKDLVRGSTAEDLVERGIALEEFAVQGGLEDRSEVPFE